MTNSPMVMISRPDREQRRRSRSPAEFSEQIARIKVQACQNQNCLRKLSRLSSSCCCAGGRRRMLWRRGLKRSLIQLSVSYTQLKALRHLAWCNGLPESKAWLDRGERSQDGHGQLAQVVERARPVRSGASIAMRRSGCERVGKAYGQSLPNWAFALQKRYDISPTTQCRFCIKFNKKFGHLNQPMRSLASGGRNEC